MPTPDYPIEIRCPRCHKLACRTTVQETGDVQMRCQRRGCRHWFAWRVESGQLRFAGDVVELGGRNQNV